MKIAALAHYAIPFRNAGGEVVLHSLLRALAEAGHDVTMWATDCPEAPAESEYEGIRIRTTRRHPLVAVQHVVQDRPDVIISQFHRAQLILKRGHRVAKTVYLIHNDEKGPHDTPLAMNPDLVVVNSDWVRESLLEKRVRLPEDVLTLHPFLDVKHRVSETGGAVTMVNLNSDKGAHVFYAMAERFPDTQFLGVEGSHGKQVLSGLPNVEIVQNSPDLRPVWKRTKIILMPSVYESYGLVAAEAGLSAIPSITAPTPGLLESRGKAGIHVERDDLDGWEKALDQLLNDPAEYALASTRSMKRSTWLLQETTRNRKKWVSSVEALVSDH